MKNSFAILPAVVALAVTGTIAAWAQSLPADFSQKGAPTKGGRDGASRVIPMMIPLTTTGVVAHWQPAWVGPPIRNGGSDWEIILFRVQEVWCGAERVFVVRLSVCRQFKVTR